MPPKVDPDMTPQDHARRALQLRILARDVGKSVRSGTSDSTMDQTEARKESNTASSTEIPWILRLPDELLQSIIDFLDVIALTRFRLQCRRLANLSVSSLFKDGFIIRPYRDDMVRLARVCLVPDLAASIRSLEIFMGDMEKSQYLDACTTTPFSRRHGVLDILEKLLDSNTSHCSRSFLEECFMFLPNLKTVSATSQISPFQNEGKPELAYFNAAWEQLAMNHNPDRTHFFDPKLLVTRYTNLLLSTLKLPTPLTKLDLDLLSMDCFAGDLSHLENSEEWNGNPPPITVNTKMLKAMQEAVANVEDLTIGIIGSGRYETVYSGEPLGRALGDFMKAMTKLRSLSIEWQVDEDIDTDCAIAWQTTFFGARFERLEDLRLVSMETPRATILKFLLRHASTLKRFVWNVDLFDIGEESFWVDQNSEDPPSWREVITSIKDNLTGLRACEIQDNSDPDQLYVGGFKSLPIQPREMVPSSKLLEMYVLNKMPWPMKDENPSMRRGWVPKHTPRYEEFCTYTPEQLEYFYSDEWETDEEDRDTSSDDGDSMDLPDDFDDEDDFEDEDEDDDDIDDDDGFSVNGGDNFLEVLITETLMDEPAIRAAMEMMEAVREGSDDVMDVDGDNSGSDGD